MAAADPSDRAKLLGRSGSWLFTRFRANPTDGLLGG